MTAEPDDIAALRADGDLVNYLLSLAGRTPVKPKPAEPEDESPVYHIARPGAWPCGTAATGPTPAPCSECTPPDARPPAPQTDLTHQ